VWLSYECRFEKVVCMIEKKGSKNPGPKILFLYKIIFQFRPSY